MIIRECSADELSDILAVVNDAATAYRGIIPPTHWREPYMPAAELDAEIASGVVFWGAFDDTGLCGVMGLQPVADVALVRHAYTRTTRRGGGIGSALLAHIRALTERPILIGTWSTATWAIRFYEKRGFRILPEKDTAALLRRYWTVPEEQAADSVVLADARWFARL